MTALLCWCNPTYKAQWKDTECSVIPDFHIQAALPDKILQQYIDRLGVQWVKSSLKIWRSLIRKHKLDEDIKILSWCAYDSDFTPNNFDSKFKVWIKKGITSLRSITQKEAIVSFQTLMDNFSLEKQDFYRYLQLRHYYNHKIKNKDTKEASKPTAIC